MIHMNTLIQDLSQRMNQEAKKREKVETDVNIRLNELLEEYGSSKLEKDQELREFDEKMKEIQAGFSTSEKQRIHMEISSVATDLSKKIDEKEAKLRIDTVNKLDVIEKQLVEENKRRAAKEKEMQQLFDNQMQASKNYGDEGSDALKKNVDENLNKMRGQVSELKKEVNSMGGQFREHKLTTEKVLTEEIKQRQREVKELNAKHEDLEDRHRLGMATLQATIGDTNRENGGTTPASPDYDESNAGSSRRRRNEPGIDADEMKEVNSTNHSKD
ncbi:hypothetical protein SK128_006821 [Halocaridina rubra]|uniref:Uncharacterized protein n=1 Tax=Halocaridina rubra TaxID=373956 RepID=A0AAN8WMW5_HALRR